MIDPRIIRLPNQPFRLETMVERIVTLNEVFRVRNVSSRVENIVSQHIGMVLTL